MKNVTKLIMMILISALVLFATACGPQARLKMSGQKSVQGDTGLTGAKNPEGKDYASFTPDVEREEMEEFVPQTQPNKDFAQNIQSIKASIENKNLQVTAKWLGIENPLVFAGALQPKDYFFAGTLPETTNQRPDLTLEARCSDTDCNMINAVIQDREGRRAALMIRREQRVLKLKIPTSEKENVKLLPPEKQAAFAEAEKGQNITLTSTEVLSGISDFEIKSDKGVIKGDVTDTTVGDQKTLAEGTFAQLGMMELVGSNARKMDVLLKIQTDLVEQKPAEVKPAPKADGKSKEKTPEPVAPAKPKKSTVYLVTEPRTPEQEEKRKVKPPVPTPIVDKVPAPIPPKPDTTTKTSVKVDPLVKQILEDADNKFVMKYVKNNLATKTDAAGKVQKNNNMDFYLACHNGDSNVCKGKVDSVKRMVDILRGKNYPAAMSMISYFESTFTANIGPMVFNEETNKWERDPNSSAYGWWQFIKGTAKANDLDPRTFDTSKDERADLEKSTVAATKYFTKLLEMWKGDLKMAIVSYHYGEGAMKKVCASKTGDASCELDMDASKPEYVKFMKDLSDQYELAGDQVNKVDKEKFWYLYESRMIKNNEKSYGDRVVKFMSFNLVSFDPKSYGYDERRAVDLY